MEALGCLFIIVGVVLLLPVVGFIVGLLLGLPLLFIGILIIMLA